MGVRQFDADVVVAGGGPAGSAAAISCATRGLSTVLFERDLFARERPGETLHPGIEPLLSQLGVADRLGEVVGARHPGIWIEWNGARRFEPFGNDASGPWAGFQVWRQDFDALLLSRAREVGVDIRQPCAVTGTDACTTVATAQGTFTARVLIDATGRARWLCRALEIDSPPRSPRLLARYGYAQGLCPERDGAPLLVGDAQGWTWTAMVRANTYQWTRLAFDGIEPDASWVPEEFRQLTPLGRSRGADVTWRIANEVARPGWFMVGDAAAILDPTSSHGVLKAIMSGMMAGHLIAAVLRGVAPAEEAAAAYHDWCAGWFAADADRLSQFYRALGVAGFT
jgi:flavin-dependent dehydrogenase